MVEISRSAELQVVELTSANCIEMKLHYHIIRINYHIIFNHESSTTILGI